MKCHWNWFSYAESGFRWEFRAKTTFGCHDDPGRRKGASKQTPPLFSAYKLPPSTPQSRACHIKITRTLRDWVKTGFLRRGFLLSATTTVIADMPSTRTLPTEPAPTSPPHSPPPRNSSPHPPLEHQTKMREEHSIYWTNRAYYGILSRCTCPRSTTSIFSLANSQNLTLPTPNMPATPTLVRHTTNTMLLSPPLPS